ncbi:uncharacterized protein BJ171DRAFT_485171 [Polychytrium aggregatum]|uniref:uncharacterized protein n=1 Tax=Polychytrium aggregatum TaxID=110093 RepID=UPI0022FE4570|nr:uncharacterized protein BJ171DRAFT_485171 [Polychytrium aggregatum]KAI9209838.1 hypothetical protein BJ171DRAFT_485171 [Polychytrium aggregatum]
MKKTPRHNLYVPKHRRKEASDGEERPGEPPSASDAEACQADEAGDPAIAADDGLALPQTGAPSKSTATGSSAEPVRRGRGNFKANFTSTTTASASKLLTKEEQTVRVYPDNTKSGSGYSKKTKRDPRTPEKNTEVDQLAEITATKLSLGESAQPTDATSEIAGKPDQEDLEEWELNDAEIAVASKPNTRSARKKPSPEPSYDEPSGPTLALELYDFPPTWKTHDIHAIFRQFEDAKGGYRLKWLEDTKALIIFGNALTAKTAYLETLDHPFVRVKPYEGRIPTDGSNSSQPRPVTTDMVARRMIAGALGVRTVRKTAEEMALDKQKLRDAENERRAQAAAKLKRERELNAAWEGS